MMFLAAFDGAGVEHEFVFKASDATVTQVDVVGTFNNWNAKAAPMTLGPDGRTWSVKLRVPLGRNQYKFVINGNTWILDPSVPAGPDGNGFTNSTIIVVPSDYDRPASPNDGVIALSALHHEMSEPDVNYDRGKLRFLFRARPDDLAAVYLDVNGAKIPMAPRAKDDLYETYEAYLPWNRKTDLSYDFVLKDGPRTAYYGPTGLTDSESSEYRLAAKGFKPFEVPSWVEKSVVYQIFPDRFADGNKSNDPPDVKPWGSKPEYWNFFGGDVAGIQQHLDYLSQLGIGAVYYTPIFKSPSNHRYDAIDYLQVDPRFGTNREFEDLTYAMKARGIRTVMDFAFNHTSPQFFAFQDIRDKGEASAYKNWYFIKSYPVVVKQNPPYVAWNNYAQMPKLNTANPETHRYILDAAEYWLKNSALSGLRLDVATEIDPQLWRDLRVEAKAINREAWIVGEDWGDANPWLGGDQWDSTMGYQFREASLHFFAEESTKPSEYMNRLMSVYMSYPPQVSRNLMNLLDSHDTPRFLTSCHGDRDLQLAAATVEFTWPGSPTIYYGDELGMEGGKDPDNRRCMDWTLATDTNPTLEYYRRLVRIRNSVRALQSGDPEVLVANDEDRTFAYARVLTDQAAVVAVNASTSSKTISLQLPQILVSASRRVGLLDAITGRRYPASGRSFSLSLPPRRAAVLLSAEASNVSSFPLVSMNLAVEPILSGHRSPPISQGAHSNEIKSLYAH